MRTDKFPIPENIFTRFCNEVQKFGKNITDAQWSKKLFNFLHDWGTSLGYRVYCREEYGQKALGEWSAIDMLWAWGSGRKDYMQFFDVALENENQDTWKHVLEDEVQKLLFTKAILKVLIYYMAENNLDEFIDELRWYIRGAFPKIPTEKYLIILGVARKGDYDFYGYVFDNNAELLKEMKQHVPMTS